MGLQFQLQDYRKKMLFFFKAKIHQVSVISFNKITFDTNMNVHGWVPWWVGSALSVKTLTRIPTSCIQQHPSAPYSSFLPMSTLGSRRQWLKYRVSSDVPCGRPGSSSWLLALACLNPGRWGRLGSERADGISHFPPSQKESKNNILKIVDFFSSNCGRYYFLSGSHCGNSIQL